MDITLTSDISVELVDFTGNDEALIRAAKVSTLGDRAAEIVEMNYEAKVGFLGYLMKNRHGSPFEHGSMTFLVRAPIFVFREWHRHRIGWSYNEESARYKELDPVFYVPPPGRPLVQTGKPGHYIFEEGSNLQYQRCLLNMEHAYQQAYEGYLDMLEEGIAREVARSVLPVGIFSSMYATCNPRSLMAFLSLRTEDEASQFPSKPQWEIQRAARDLEAIFMQLYPITARVFHMYGRVSP